MKHWLLIGWGEVSSDIIAMLWGNFFLRISDNNWITLNKATRYTNCGQLVHMDGTNNFPVY
jgi:hypothetical protein